MTFAFLSLQISLVLLLTTRVATLQYFPDGITADNTISSECGDALTVNITSCPDDYLLYPVTDFGGPFLNSTSHASFCSAACSVALASYQSSVLAACKSDPDPWDGIPAVFSGDRMAAYQKRMCLKDPKSGQYCIDYFANYTIPTTVASITDLPQDFKCSTCYLNFMQAMQATPYSNYDESWVVDYQTIQSSCGVNYPTSVSPWPLNVTKTIPPGIIGQNTTTNPFCLSGNYVTIKSGDSCESVAEANSVNTGTFRIINNIFPDCTNLIADASLCLPMTCRLYKVQANDTCWSIASTLGSNFTIIDIMSYNPTLNDVCSNLIVGESICISPATGQYTPTLIPGATATQVAIYATSTIAAPGPTASGTTPQCGKYYKVQSGDLCEQISLNNTIAVDLFEAINPSIDSLCHNLVPDLWYCVFPTAQWNQSSTTLPKYTGTLVPPEPTPSGTTSQCYKWYIAQPNDYCYLITSSQGITQAQFQSWNPSIDSKCGNIIPGDAYCVKGPAIESATTSATTTMAKTTTSTSSSSSSSSISPNGICGAGISCVGSGFGNCCSKYGYCGSTSDYCGGANCVSGACTPLG